MDFPGITSSQLEKRPFTDGQEAAFASVMTTKGATGAVGPIPLPSRSDVERAATQMYTVFFGDAVEHLGNAARRTFELPSHHLHLDGAIAGIAIRYRDELARMRELHSDVELRAIARAGAEVAFEALNRGDITGFLPQFEANVFAAMNLASQRMRHDRSTAASGSVAGPQQPLQWDAENHTGGPQWQGIGVEGGGWQPGTAMPFGEMSGMPSDFMQLPGFDESLPDFAAIREEMDALSNRGIPPLPASGAASPAIVSPTEMLRNAERQGQRHALEEAERAAREAIERSLGNSPFVTGADPIAEAIDEHGPLVGLFLHALRPQFAPGSLGGAPSGPPGISTATINALRNLDPKVAADLVNDQLSETLENIPSEYRDAISEALGQGNEPDPEIAKALSRLDALRRAESPDAIDAPPVVTNVPDAIRLLRDRYGMNVTDDLANAGSDRTYHTEQSFLEVVNHAIPILDRINAQFPGALTGLGLAVKSPNTRAAEREGYLTLGVSSGQTGVISLTAPSEISGHNIAQDPDLVFQGTVAHEVMHALIAKSDPMLVTRFMENYQPIATAYGPGTENPSPGAMSRQDLIDEMFFPGASWEQFLDWAQSEGYVLQPSGREILESREETDYGPHFIAGRYEGEVTIFQNKGEPVEDIVGETVSRYGGYDEHEALSETFSAMILGPAEPIPPGGALPYNTPGINPENPPPRYLLQHVRDIVRSAMHAPGPDSFYMPQTIDPDTYGQQE